ncbi:MAG: hypothetical protein K0Q56_395 [Sporolactobacillus laevolacticus]|nr:hypothetical protein [Sporolactobacillus laevolacticus]
MTGTGGGVLKEYLLNLFSDPDFIGSLLGSILSGLTAVSVLFFQIHYQNKKELKQKYQNFNKYMNLFISIARTSDKFFKMVDLNKVLDEQDSLNYAMFWYNIRKLKAIITSVDDKIILPDVYEYFLFSRDSLETLEMFLKSLESTQDELRRKDLKKAIIGQFNRLMKQNQKLYEMQNKIEKEINK